MFGKHLRTVLSVLLLTFATAGVSAWFVVQSISAQDQDIVAFTVKSRNIIYAPSGAPVLTQVITMATRSDGSTVMARTMNKPGNRGTAEQRNIQDLSSREQVIVDGLTESIMSVPIPREAVESRREQIRMTCSPTEPAEHDKMLGYDVFRFVQDDKSTPRFMRTEEWRAPALNCLPMKTTIFRGKTESDAYVSNLEEIVEIKSGEPPASLFARPSAGYIERSPSQRTAEFLHRYPEEPCPGCVMQGDKRDDEIYFRKRSSGGF
jgi:hypothetical protein